LCPFTNLRENLCALCGGLLPAGDANQTGTCPGYFCKTLPEPHGFIFGKR